MGWIGQVGRVDRLGFFISKTSINTMFLVYLHKLKLTTDPRFYTKRIIPNFSLAYVYARKIFASKHSPMAHTFVRRIRTFSQQKLFNIT